jgi:hypothetical protein
MPSRDTVERFIARIEANAHDAAAAEFHHPEVVLRENQEAPRVGREQQVAREQAILAKAKSVRSTCVRPALIDGDFVAIRWIFEFDWGDGSFTRMEEVAWQRWQGEQLVEETFFYDPAQRARRPASA